MIRAALGDTHDLLRATCGLYSNESLFVIVQSLRRIGRPFDFECPADVRNQKPLPSLVGDRTQRRSGEDELRRCFKWKATCLLLLIDCLCCRCHERLLRVGTVIMTAWFATEPTVRSATKGCGY